MRALYRLLSIVGDAKALSRGPAPYFRRKARAASHRALSRALRKVLRP